MDSDNKDSRNIADRYKGWMADLIKQDLDKKSFPYAVLMEHWQNDFNLGTLVRNANAFGAREVYYIGKRRWDRRGSVGTYHYTNLLFLEDAESALTELASRYTIIGIDNVPGSFPITDFVWPDNVLMVFGEEGVGLTPEIQSYCSAIVEIPMFGSVRSLNCGTASGIVMFDYVNKFQKKKLNQCQI